MPLGTATDLFRRLRGGARGQRVLLITDPGPDPDDVKALLVLAVLHMQKEVALVGVVCNGGCQPRARARLARCVLNNLGVDDVPVAVGSEGKPYGPQPHEYRLAGYDAVDDASLVPGGVLIARVLNESPARGLTLVCISSLRDFADAIVQSPALVQSKVSFVSIMGGLDPSKEAPFGYVPDTSVNNEFDPAAANTVYDWCFAHGVPMAVVSRFAVPVLPMRLAKSFAERIDCPVMRYLADAQFLGLEGLWRKLCEGKLPARCTKQWYFETFCAVDAQTFAGSGMGALDADAEIRSHLNGYVKPYDVIALMAALPAARAAFPSAAVEVVPTALRRGAPAVVHHLLIGPEHMIDVRHVTRLLRETYHEIVVATNAHIVETKAAKTRARNPSSGVSVSRSASSGKRERPPSVGDRISTCAVASSLDDSVHENSQSGNDHTARSVVKMRNRVGNDASSKGSSPLPGRHFPAMSPLAGRRFQATSPLARQTLPATSPPNSKRTQSARGRMRTSPLERPWQAAEGGAPLGLSHESSGAYPSSVGAEAAASTPGRSSTQRPSVAPVSAPGQGPRRTKKLGVFLTAVRATVKWQHVGKQRASRSSLDSRASRGSRDFMMALSRERNSLNLVEVWAFAKMMDQAMDRARACTRRDVVIAGCVAAFLTAAILVTICVDIARADGRYFTDTVTSAEATAIFIRLRALTLLVTPALLLVPLSLQPIIAHLHAAQLTAVVNASFMLACAVCWMGFGASHLGSTFMFSAPLRGLGGREGEDSGALELARGVVCLVASLGMFAAAGRQAWTLAWRAHDMTAVLYSVWDGLALLGVSWSLMWIFLASACEATRCLEDSPVEETAARVHLALVLAQAVFLSLDSTRLRLRLILVRLSAMRLSADEDGVLTPLAPLQGVGTAHERPHERAALDALASFWPLELDASTISDDLFVPSVLPARACKDDADTISSWVGRTMCSCFAIVVRQSTAPGASAGDKSPYSRSVRRSIRVVPTQEEDMPASPSRSGRGARASDESARKPRLSVENVRMHDMAIAEAELGGAPGSPQGKGPRGWVLHKAESASVIGQVTPTAAGAASPDASSRCRGAGPAPTASGGAMEAAPQITAAPAPAPTRISLGEKLTARLSVDVRPQPRMSTAACSSNAPHDKGGGRLSLRLSNVFPVPAPSRRSTRSHHRNRGIAFRSRVSIRHVEDVRGTRESGPLVTRRAVTMGVRAVRLTKETSEDMLSGRLIASLVSRATGSSTTHPSRRTPAFDARGQQFNERTAAHGAYSDYYVVHSSVDSASERARALRCWALARADEKGGPVTAWVDELSADTSMSASEQLAQLPYYLCRCRRLLLIIGPEFTFDTWVAIELFTWLATGGSVASVDVVLTGDDDEELEEAVACFDVFHVRFARVNARPEVQERLQRAIELAGVVHFNEAVRSFLPAVRRAVWYADAGEDGDFIECKAKQTSTDMDAMP